jgi:acid phosphatase type 7
MSRGRALVRPIVVSAGLLALVALASLTGIAQSRSAQPSAKTRAPLRAIFYITAPVRSSGAAAGRPTPSAAQGGPAGVRRHLAALKWARADAAIVPWAAPGSAADRKLAAVLAAVASTHAHVRVAALIDRRRGTEVAQLEQLAASRAIAPGYLRIASRPAVFVASADRSLRDCARARRWRAAARAFWLAQATFPGYGQCRSAADAWFRDEPDTRSARATGTFVIRPGFWPRGSKVPALERSTSAWQRSIKRMNTSGAPLQLVDSLNDWAHGTAIEPSAAWSSDSGFGSYLDALHVQPPGVVPRAAAPSVEAVAVSGVSAHAASVAATVSAGSSAAASWVEFGATTAYGQLTAPVTLAPLSPRRQVTVALTALSAATTYHARVVVASAVGRVAGPDAVFKTLADPRAMRVAAAGDIACTPESSDFNDGAGTATECHQLGVSDAILAGGYDAVLPLGDVQYNSGTASEFAGSYEPSWGRLKAISHPAVGNHEYGSPGAAPYFQYFGAAAGEPGKGYYSYNVGSWHLIALNSNCAQIGGCASGSAQELWLHADLAAHPVRCTLAYWHHPLFSSGQNGSAGSTRPLWTTLYAAGADLVLTGHDHDYERFAPQDAAGERDDAKGIREFVVGTGGRNHMTFKAIQPNSEVHDTSSFGFLELTLSDGAYAWKFVSDPPGGFSDSGSGSCH